MACTSLLTTDDALAFLRARNATGLCSDTRRMRMGEAFIAWPGLAVDPRRHVQAALLDGASACLVDADGVGEFRFDDPRIAVLPGLKLAAGAIADRFYDAPSARVDVAAVTGTNGKTSTAWWTAQVLSRLGKSCGLIGTLGSGLPFDAEGRHVAGSVEPTGFTTPDPVTLHVALARFEAAGATACALEASSIGIDEQRLSGLRIAVAQFTNFTRDHLDYHETMEAYWAAKDALFDWEGLRAAVINLDDERGAELAERLEGSTLDLWTTAVHQRPARLVAEGLAYAGGGLRFNVREGEESHLLHTQMVGEYNVANLLAVLGAARAMGFALADAVHACEGLEPVPGRMQRVAVDGDEAERPLAIVDYAHTPDALDKALRALQPLAAARGGRLWCIFGCGGDRDATKRPLMGAIAQRLADRVVITSDNPRTESPTFILSQIMAGLCGHEEVDVIEDRAQAIAYALREAAPADVVLVAGKGHEATQEIAGRKLPFSDDAHARAALLRRAGL